MFVLPSAESQRAARLWTRALKLKHRSAEFVQRFKSGGFQMTMSAKDYGLLKLCDPYFNPRSVQ
jgi:hypothetical protein